ncbi:MAG: hypothetical protein ACI9F2_000188 [Lysobacterales bacterium]|jgi:hypothetical protein
MNRFILILLLIIGLGGGYYYYQSQRMQESGFDQVLPENPVVYIEINDVAKNIEYIKTLKVWKDLKDIDLDAVSKKGKNLAKMPEANILDKIKEKMPDETTKQLLMKGFGDDVVIALYESNIDLVSILQMQEVAEGVLADALSGLYVVTRIGADLQLADSLNSMFDIFGTRGDIETNDFNGQKYHEVFIDDVPFNGFYTRHKDMIVLSFSEEGIHKAINVIHEKEKALADDADFQKSKESRLESYFSYSNLESLSKLVEEAAKLDTTEGTSTQVQQAVAKVKGLKSAVFTGVIGMKMRSNFSINYDQASMDRDHAQMLKKCVNYTNKTLAYIPENVMAYQWSGCMDWEGMLNQADGQAGVDNFQKFKTMAMPYLDIVGDEIGVYLSELNTQMMFPIPKLVLFIDIQDQERAEETLGKLTQNPMVILKTTDYEGYTIYAAQSPMATVISPAYAFIDGYLFITTHVDLLHKSIDVKKNADLSLVDNNAFKELIGNAKATDNSGAAYYQVGRLAGKFIEYMDWGKNMLRGKEDKKNAFKEGSLRRLEDLKKRIARKQEDLEKAKNKQIVLEDEIWNLETQSLDASVQQEQMVMLGEKIETLIKDVAGAEAQAEDARVVVAEYDTNDFDTQSAEGLLDNLATPILKSLININTFSSVTSTDGQRTNVKAMMDVK